MELVLDAIAIVAVWTGTGFAVVGIIGYLRLPDVLSRLHAAGKVSALGVTLLLVAAAFRPPLSWGHSLVLIFFLLLTGPVVSHALASAALRMGLTPSNLARNDLAPILEPSKSEKKSQAPFSS